LRLRKKHTQNIPNTTQKASNPKDRLSQNLTNGTNKIPFITTETPKDKVKSKSKARRKGKEVSVYG